MSFKKQLSEAGIEFEGSDANSFLSNLLNEGSEFCLTEVDETKENEHRVDQCFDFADFAQHINLECVTLDPMENKAGTTPFEIFKTKMFKLTDDEGVMKRILREGVTAVPKNAVVYVHYNCYLEMEEVPFDSSYLRSEEPERFQLGSQTIYKGLELGIVSMKKGEKSQFLIHHNYAFGEMGVPPRIPPAATILVEVELMRFVDCGSLLNQGDDISVVTDKNDFEGIYSKAMSHHALANDFFGKKSIGSAITNYRKAEKLLISCRLKNDEEETKMKHLLLKIYINLMVCYNNPEVNIPQKVCIYAREALNLTPEARKSAKLYFNIAQAHLKFHDFTKAMRNFQYALRLEPHNEVISQEMLRLEEKKKKYYQYEKITYAKALGLKNDAQTQPKTETKFMAHNVNALEEKKKKYYQYEKITYAKALGLKNDAQTQPKTETKFMAHNVNADLGDDVKETFKSLVEDFKQSKHSVLHLPSGLMNEEKKLCKTVADSLGLIFKYEIICGKHYATISKDPMSKLQTAISDLKLDES